MQLVARGGINTPEKRASFRDSKKLNTKYIQDEVK